MIRATLEAAESKQKISPLPVAIVSNQTAETTDRAMPPSTQSMIRATLEAAESKQKISPRPAAIVSNHTAETTKRAMLPSSQSMMELKRPAVISGELKERLDKLLGTVNGAL